ncbi:MAG TPA: hypothetical protein VFC85_02550 [Verrucomicrobiae bacterium]|nr:hypothetical protein [Verrucomicrobiae bacterium]
MNAGQNNVPPILKPPVWNRQIKICSKCVLSLFVSLVLIALYGAGCFDSNRTKINEWLKFHQLAQLPQSATNVMYHQWNGIFTGETYIRFQMPSNDLAMFITNSLGGLSQGKSDIFTPKHQHLPFPKNNSEWDMHNDYFGVSRMFPDWFNPSITNRGRGYILDRGPNSEVYINEETSTVYLRSIKG